MEKEKLLEEIDKYIEAHYIPDKYDDIVMDQEMKSIFESITEFRKKQSANKEAVRKPQEIECSIVAESRTPYGKEDEEKPAFLQEIECSIVAESRTPYGKEDEEKPDFDTGNYTKKKLTKPIHDAQITNRKIDDLMNQLEETFSQRLMRMIVERDAIESDIYKKAYVDRRHFSKIKKDINYSPNKKTVFAFAIALELSIDETKDLLACAGYALSKSSKFDIIIAYFLQNKIYDMFEINDILYAYDLPIFE